MQYSLQRLLFAMTSVAVLVGAFRAKATATAAAMVCAFVTLMIFRERQKRIAAEAGRDTMTTYFLLVFFMLLMLGWLFEALATIRRT